MKVQIRIHSTERKEKHYQINFSMFLVHKVGESTDRKSVTIDYIRSSNKFDNDSVVKSPDQLHSSSVSSNGCSMIPKLVSNRHENKRRKLNDSFAALLNCTKICKDFVVLSRSIRLLISFLSTCIEPITIARQTQLQRNCFVLFFILFQLPKMSGK